MTQKLKAYQKYLEQKQLQPETIKIYLWHLQQFFNWLKDKKLTNVIFKNYYDYLIKNYAKVATINLRLVILNDYLKFQKEKFQFNLLSAEKQDLEILTKQQLQDFLEAPFKNSSQASLRDKLLLEFLYFSGLKVGQIVKIKKEHFDFKKDTLNFEQANIKIPATIKSHLLKYLNQRTDENIWLFINFDRAQKSTNNNQQLSVRSVERILEKYARTLEPILRITPQTLRHTLAYNLKQAGGSVATIRAALHFQTQVAAEEYFKKL